MELNKELLELTRPYVNRPDQVQGPGGNTSVKDSGGRMMIKASGFRFEEINENRGFSLVNNQVIKDFFFHVQPQDKVKEEQESVALILDHVLRDEKGDAYPKPSMETGFHSVLGTYVVHTHSVWTNLVNCCADNIELISRIRQKTSLRIANIPYVSPGFGLSYLIAKEIRNASENEYPQVFFLENHGIIAHGSGITEVNSILCSIDQAIMDIFNLSDTYPGVQLQDLSGQFIPDDPFVNDMIKHYLTGPEFFEHVLFPDQTVFFKDNIGFGNNSGKKIRVDGEGHISYHAGHREALSMHETMTAYLFIYHNIVSNNRQLRFIPSAELDYINAMDMEKHRKSLMD